MIYRVEASQAVVFHVEAESEREAHTIVADENTELEPSELGPVEVLDVKVRTEDERVPGQ